MSASGPDGPATAVIKGKIKEAVEGNNDQGKDIDHTPGDRLRKGQQSNFLANPRAQERVLAAADPSHPPKGPAEMPEEARQMLHSEEVHSLNIPKRGN